MLPFHHQGPKSPRSCPSSASSRPCRLVDQPGPIASIASSTRAALSFFRPPPEPEPHTPSKRPMGRSRQGCVARQGGAQSDWASPNLCDTQTTAAGWGLEGPLGSAPLNGTSSRHTQLQYSSLGTWRLDRTAAKARTDQAPGFSVYSDAARRLSIPTRDRSRVLVTPDFCVMGDTPGGSCSASRPRLSVSCRRLSGGHCDEATDANRTGRSRSIAGSQAALPQLAPRQGPDPRFHHRAGAGC